MIQITKRLLKRIEAALYCRIVSYTHLGHGEHNVNFLLKTDKKKAVLRIYANTQFDNAEKEYRVLKKLDGRFAPKVYLFDNSQTCFSYGFMVQEFIEGTCLQKFTDEDLKKVAHLLRAVHHITDNRRERTWKSPISAWCKKNILQTSAYLGETFQKDMVELHKAVAARLKQIAPALRRHKRIHLVHDDVIPQNIIKTKAGDLILVDWELATFDYFFTEFGCVLGENGLSKRQEKLFLKEYGFGLRLVEKKIIHAMKINRALSCISWFIERIAAINQGKQIFVGQDRSKYQKLLGKEQKHIRQLLAQSV